ncbi:MAG: extracellular matrix regulator RemB [Oscillospiraceae bacterium]
MYLFLGGNSTVRKDDVIGIFDIEETSVSRITADFLNSEQKQGRIIYASDDMPKAFVVCSQKTYITNVSNDTLNKRCWIEFT